MEVDITKYAPVISKILTKLKVKKQDREDLTQECYLALLEKHKHLVRGIELGTENSFATSICRSRVTDIWRRDHQDRGQYKTKAGVRFDSLSDPRVYRKAAKVIEPIAELDSEIDSGELEAAILSLPFDEFRVIYEVFVEGKTQASVAQELGISIRTVGTRQQKGISGLKKYFKVDNEPEL
jgi:RNA polymerase sigma factor (sigma-70 family)